MHHPNNEMVCIHLKPHIQNGRMLIMIEAECWVSKIYYTVLFFVCLKFYVKPVLYVFFFFFNICFLRLVTKENAHDITLSEISRGGIQYKPYKVWDSNFVRNTDIHRVDSLKGNSLKWWVVSGSGWEIQNDGYVLLPLFHKYLNNEYALLLSLATWQIGKNSYLGRKRGQESATWDQELSKQ